jgi:hypothetical protein
VATVKALMSRRVLLWLFLLGMAGAAHAQAPRIEAAEASIKAAFLYKFAGYVGWPPSAFASAEAPFVIGVVGADEVANELVKFTEGRHLGGHPVTVRRIGETQPTRGVHVLFIGRNAADRASIIARAAQQPAVLVVTEAERALEAGSAINFVTAEDRVGFEVSLDAAERKGLKISSRMLGVARRVLQKGSS